jgi:uncharacterized protein GlcG (DUF336 family)
MTSTITLAGADKAIEAGKAKAAELGIAFTIAIVDAAANLVAFSRQDGAAPPGADSELTSRRMEPPVTLRILFSATPAHGHA